MSRTIKFSKKDIMEKSLEFIELYGYSKLTVRELAKYIGCSTQPFFRLFNNMEEYKKELKVYLHDYYDLFISKIIKKDDYLFTISYAYTLFALKEPNIFKSLFMSDLAGSRTIEEVLNSSWNLDTINSIPKQYGVSIDDAKSLYRDIRFFTHGLSCQIAIKSIVVNEEEIRKLISNIISKVSFVIENKDRGERL